MQSRGSRALAALLALALVVGLGQAAAQEDVDIDDLREQRDRARDEQLHAQAAFDALDAEFEDVQAAFEAADELVRLAEERSDAILRQLELAELRLARTEVGIQWAEYDRELLAEDIADIAVREYLGLQDEPNLLAEENPTEALSREVVLDAIQGANYDIVDTARSAESEFADLREQAAADLAEVVRLTEELKAELDELEEAREIRQRARDTIDQRREEWLDRVDELDRQEAEFDQQIRDEQRRLDAERARSAAAANAEERAAAASAGLDAISSGEGYVWPTAGGIGSYFGPRRHPILGITRLHGGLDIGGRMGQPIWAAKEGVVILAGVNGGYGNTIVIDHGNGFLTLYGHQSTFEVRKGDYVETGQHIGNVGSTGLSTGPHLHFEVRVDGTVTDPLPYLPPR
ncbi:MAG: peptidoglycan DD-metalloendopeptidase family protein [Actinomycetota bacterium]